MGKALSSEPAAARAARKLAHAERAVVLARGVHYSTAFEIALKLKELALLLTEPFSAADFQHGPIAMAEKDLPVILVSPPGTRPEARDALRRARSRAPGKPGDPDRPAWKGAISVPEVPELLAPIVSVIPGQLLAYHAALIRGLDPDRPRGIRKVTETR